MLNRKESGQTLVEVLVAIGIVVVVLTGVADLVTRSSKVVRIQRQRDEANSLLLRKISDYMVEKDGDPESFFDPLNRRSEEDCGEYEVNGATYVCRANFVYDFLSVDTIKLTVSIYWSDREESDTNISYSALLINETN